MKKEKRRKLSDAAIAFIIEERDNPLTVYTFEEISKLVETKFKISIGRGAVSKSYHKHKDDKRFKIEPVKAIMNNGSELETHLSKEKPIKAKPVFEPIEVKINQKNYDENAGKEFDSNDFFKPKKQEE